jgi:hypothetical protein
MKTIGREKGDDPLYVSTHIHEPKVAILLYGMLRSFQLTAASFQRHVVGPNNADVFYFGPVQSDVATKEINGRLDVFGNLKDNPKGLVDSTNGIDREAFFAAYGPAMRSYGFHHVDQEEFVRQAEAVVDRRDWIYGLNPARLFSMVFNIEGVVHLLEEYERTHGVIYDIVIITRPDIAFFSSVRAKARKGVLHIPCGEGFDEWGRKHMGNARVLYYKNVETGDYVQGGDTVTFNDQVFLLARADLSCFSGLSKALTGYLTQQVPASPETILYLHLCLRQGLKPLLHPEWCYQIQRAGMPLIENISDTSMIRVVDRYHYKAQERWRKNPLGCLLRDAKLLIKRVAYRLAR